MKDCVERLREKNIRVTPQRVGVCRILSGRRFHFTAEEIFNDIKKEFPSISLATVYSILDLFKEKYFIQELRIDFNKSRFEINVDQHHHFYCIVCKNILDVDMPLCESLQREEVDGHKIETFQGYFYGTCKKCRK